MTNGYRLGESVNESEHGLRELKLNVKGVAGEKVMILLRFPRGC